MAIVGGIAFVNSGAFQFIHKNIRFSHQIEPTKSNHIPYPVSYGLIRCNLKLTNTQSLLHKEGDVSTVLGTELSTTATLSVASQ